MRMLLSLTQTSEKCDTTPNVLGASALIFIMRPSVFMSLGVRPRSCPIVPTGIHTRAEVFVFSVL